MGFKARVYNVFIASPNDVSKERSVIRRQIEKWNAIHSEKENIVLLPVGWESHSMSEIGTHPQDFINQTVLSKCDFLIGVFWTKIGTPIPREKSGTIDEIKAHIRKKKPAMLFFSTKDLPSNADLNQVQKVRDFKTEMRDKSFYVEYSSITEFESVVYKQLELFVNSGKIHVYYDSDLVSMTDDDIELSKKIENHFPIVARRILTKIIDEKHDKCVWNALINKLKKSPADLRESLYFMTDRVAFSHPFFEQGCETLAECSQVDYFSLLTYVYDTNIYTFEKLYAKKLLTEENLVKQMEIMLNKDRIVDDKIREKI